MFQMGIRQLSCPKLIGLENCSKYRAYSGSEFVVANTLAKWKKLEPNKINLSQGFSQKVSTNCFVFNSNTADNLCKQFGPRSGPTIYRA